MNFVSAARVTKFAFQNFTRNAWLSVVTILILTLAIFLISIFASVQVIGNKAIEAVLSKVDVAVFFTQNTSDQQLQSITKQLQERTDVVSVQGITADEALDEFKKENANDPIIRESLEALGLNPLGPVLVIKARTLDDYPAILALFDSESIRPLIQDKQRDFTSKQVVIERLSNITRNLKNVGISLATIFAAIAILVIFNTIRITIYTHREEIGIMKLVGASNGFVRIPFIIESLLYAVIATVITALAFTAVLYLAAPYINKFFEGYSFNALTYYSGHVWQFVALQLISAILLSTLSAAIAVGRYLRV